MPSVYVSLFGSLGEFIPDAAIGGDTRTVRIWWDDMSYDSYNVGYDSVTHASEDRNDVSIYPNSYNTTGTTDGAGHLYYDVAGVTGTLYFAVAGINGELVSPWGTEESDP